MTGTIKILAIGDIVGRPGREIIRNRLPDIIAENNIDFVIANGENASDGRNISPKNTQELLSYGIDVLTSGNHIWQNKKIYEIIDSEPRLLRPANFPEEAPGHGVYSGLIKGKRICIINLIGRVAMMPVDCPFKKFDVLYTAFGESADIVIVDFHAEATAEKQALAWHADGRASAVFGTHTHVQTADERVLPGGTGYITDIGMTGAFDSVIGMDRTISIRNFLLQTGQRHEVAVENVKLQGAVFTFDECARIITVERMVA